LWRYRAAPIVEEHERRRARIRALRKRGWTLQRIADRYGITPQRVHQLLLEPKAVEIALDRAWSEPRLSG
jgi:transcriptional regulator with XRE-family HTH domain